MTPKNEYRRDAEYRAYAQSSSDTAADQDLQLFSELEKLHDIVCQTFNVRTNETAWTQACNTFVARIETAMSLVAAVMEKQGVMPTDVGFYIDRAHYNKPHPEGEIKYKDYTQAQLSNVPEISINVSEAKEVLSELNDKINKSVDSIKTQVPSAAKNLPEFKKFCEMTTPKKGLKLYMRIKVFINRAWRRFGAKLGVLDPKISKSEHFTKAHKYLNLRSNSKGSQSR